MPTEQKRERIMQAAARIFANRRFHEVTLEEVAQAARVGKGTIYLHFRDKDDLFFETATWGFDALCEVLRGQVPDDAPFRERLLGACERICAFFEKRRPLFRLMHGQDGRVIGSHHELQQRWTVKRAHLIAAVTAILDEGVAKGEIRGDVPADVQAVYLLGMLRTRAHDLSGEGEAARRLESLLDLFWHGVAKPSTPVLAVTRRVAEARPRRRRVMRRTVP